MAGFFLGLIQKLRQIVNRILGRKKKHPSDPDWERRNVLVGVLRRKVQLDVCLACKFYHIPAAELKNVDEDIEYIAIYQSRRLFGKDAGIRYYGRVRKCGLVPRCEIPEIYSEKRDPYYRFDVEGWKQLPQVLTAKEKGFVSFLTSFHLLTHSREVPQLWLRNREELRLYDGILDAAESPLIDRDPEKLTFEAMGCRFEFREGHILIRRDGAVLSRHEIAQFRFLPYTVLQRMLHDIG